MDHITKYIAMPVSMEVPLKTRNRSTTWCHCTTIENMPKRLCIIPHRYLLSYVYFYVIFISQEMEAAYNWWMDNGNVAHINDGIYSCDKKIKLVNL